MGNKSKKEDQEAKLGVEEDGQDQAHNMNPESEDSDINTASSEEQSVENGEDALFSMKEKYLRLVAEFDNYKKRTNRERMNLINTAGESTILKLLPVLDDFDRAKSSADDESTGEVFTEGVTLVYEKLYKTLGQMGLSVMETNHEEFNPELHEAITKIPVQDESMKGKIVDTIERGYLLHDKIIRYAKVVVGN